MRPKPKQTSSIGAAAFIGDSNSARRTVTGEAGEPEDIAVAAEEEPVPTHGGVEDSAKVAIVELVQETVANHGDRIQE